LFLVISHHSKSNKNWIENVFNLCLSTNQIVYIVIIYKIKNMLQISQTQIEQALNYPELITALKTAFQSDITVPMRHHHDFANPLEQKDSTLLLMPAWEAGKYLGVKIVTVSPNNGVYKLPSIQGMYILMDAHKGSPLALMEAKTLTAFRTAAASALAASYLACKDSKVLLMIGTGALAPQLIRAHAAVRPIERVYVWGRDLAKATTIVEQFKTASFAVEAVDNIAEAVAKADIISCATLSPNPLLKGDLLRNGQHIDLVGSYRRDMREADDAVIQRSSVFVDTYAGATKETGDIVIPLEKGILTKEAIRADLFELCKGEKKGRQTESEITLFKSVGHALEDLAAAKLVYEKLKIN